MGVGGNSKRLVTFYLCSVFSTGSCEEGSFFFPHPFFLFWYFFWKVGTGKMSAHMKVLGSGCMEECIFSQSYMHLMDESASQNSAWPPLVLVPGRPDCCWQWCQFAGSFGSAGKLRGLYREWDGEPPSSYRLFLLPASLPASLPLWQLYWGKI